MKKWRKAVGAAVLLAAVAAVAGVTGGTASTKATQKTCSFQLRIGDVLPFTGGLAAYGANLDRAVKLAVSMDNATLKRLKLKKMSVKLVGSEDGQTQAAASVEAATKLVKANHVKRDHRRDGLGRDDPDGAVGGDPEPRRRDLPDVERASDHEHQGQRLPLARLSVRLPAGRVLAQAAIGAFGKGKTVNVGARNDAFGTALKQLFVAQYKKLGGKVGETLRWNPDQANFDTEAGRLVSGNPAG